MEVQKITPPLAFHWAARVSYPSEPWRNHALCVWSWRELRKIFPECYAAILMPDHLHVLSATLAPSEIQTRLKELHRFLKRLARKTATPLGWQPLSEPRAIPNWSHLATQIRYVHLNPCRKGYCKDPLEWEFSTHRDYLGATAQPWPDTANALTRMSHGVNYYGRASFHAYVSGDPSVHPAGTPPPIQAAQPAPVLNLIALARAFEVTHRLPHGATRRKSRARRQFARASWPWDYPPAQRLGT
jgi:REP element-mobilizing transposase RayT